MGRLPREPRVQRPSPLQQVQLTRPLSKAPPEMGLVRDPQFWKRFSTAVHKAESTTDLERGPSSASSVDKKHGDQWLVQQHKEKRNCRILCASITVAVILVIAAAAFVGWYFTQIR